MIPTFVFAFCLRASFWFFLSVDQALFVILSLKSPWRFNFLVVFVSSFCFTWPDFPQVCLANSQSLRDRPRYPMTVQMYWSEDSVNPARVAFMQYMQWKKVAIIFEDIEYFRLVSLNPAATISETRYRHWSSKSIGWKWWESLTWTAFAFAFKGRVYFLVSVEDQCPHSV